jgi:hypothetical protein
MASLAWRARALPDASGSPGSASPPDSPRGGARRGARWWPARWWPARGARARPAPAALLALLALLALRFTLWAPRWPANVAQLEAAASAGAAAAARDAQLEAAASAGAAAAARDAEEQSAQELEAAGSAGAPAAARGAEEQSAQDYLAEGEDGGRRTALRGGAAAPDEPALGSRSWVGFMRCRVPYERDFGYDHKRRWVRLSAAQIAAADARNPFLCDGEEGLQKTVRVPAFSYSKGRQDYVFGGLTADMGWPLMLSRYSLTSAREHDRAVQFFPRWGHGCAAEQEQQAKASWTCLFDEVTPRACVAPDAKVEEWLSVNREQRHQAKLYDIFSDEARPERARERNKGIVARAGLEGVLPFDSDIAAMRILFRWVFRLRPEARRRVEELKAPLLERLRGQPFSAIHIRWGDKVGRGGGPQESLFIPAEKHVDALDCYYRRWRGLADVPRTVFVASDDYAAVRKVSAYLGRGFNVVTSAEPSDKGFHLDTYRTATSDAKKFDTTLRLWADMEVMAAADAFVGNHVSNVVKVVHMMRIDKEPASTINVFDVHVQEPSCCTKPDVASKMANCFTQCV